MPLRTQEAGNKVFLMQIPDDVYQAWQNAPAGAMLGKIDGGSESLAGKKRLRMQLDARLVPKGKEVETRTQFYVNNTVKVGGRLLVIDQAHQQASFEGVEAASRQVQPDTRDPAFRHWLKERKRQKKEEDKLAKAARIKGMTGHEARTAITASSREFLGIKLDPRVAEQAKRSSKRSQIDEEGRALDPFTKEEAVAMCNQLHDGRVTAIGLLEILPYWSMQDLKSFVREDEASLRQALREQCDYIRSGPRRNCYTLKSQLRTTTCAPTDEEVAKERDEAEDALERCQQAGTAAPGVADLVRARKRWRLEDLADVVPHADLLGSQVADMCDEVHAGAERGPVMALKRDFRTDKSAEVPSVVTVPDWISARSAAHKLQRRGEAVTLEGLFSVAPFFARDDLVELLHRQEVRTQALQLCDEVRAGPGRVVLVTRDS